MLRLDVPAEVNLRRSERAWQRIDQSRWMDPELNGGECGSS